MLFQDMLDERRKMKYELSMLEADMFREVVNFQGSIKEAIKSGMVKLTFPMPSKWMQAEEME